MERGGRADKFGNEFEKLWVVDQALRRVLCGEAQSLRWEPLPPEGEGIDLQVFSNDGWEAQQCKTENRDRGKWTIGELAQRNVLEAIRIHLEQKKAVRFVFVSRDRSDLDDLAERARHCDGDPRAFRESSLANARLKRSFETLCHHWKIDPNVEKDVGRALALLGRCRHESGITSTTEKETLSLLAELLLVGEGRKIVDALARVLSEEIGNRIHADQLRMFLIKEGYPPRDLAGDPRVPEAIERRQRDFDALLELDLIAGRVLTRQETQQLLNLLTDDHGPRIIFLHGDAGAGKSGVLLELTRELNRRSVPYLPLRLDNQRLPQGSLESYSRTILELPAPPQICLHSLAGDRTSVLVIDQLDAIRWAGLHSSESWILCRAMIDSALELPGMKVVLACRTFDLQDHPHIRHWEASKRAHDKELVRRIEVSGLDENAVKKIVDSLVGRYASMSKAQRKLLSNAHGLQLWCRLIEKGTLPPEFENKTDLIKSFWDDCFNRAHMQAGISRERLTAALGMLIDYLDAHPSPVVPELLFSDAQDVQKFLLSQSILHASARGEIRFSHQSHLDHLIAARVAKEALADDRRPVEWIRENDQSLHRREQLRQLLMLLRDQRHDRYLAALRSLLYDEDIRFHLRHLALGLLRAAASPTESEIDFVVDLIDDDSWRSQVFSQVLSGSVSWFDLLMQRGIWGSWLASENEERIELAIRGCRTQIGARGEAVLSLLLPYWKSDQQVWRERIASVLSHRPWDDTANLFAWRLELVRSGDATDLGSWYELPELAAKNPRRALDLLVVMMRCGSGRLRLNRRLISVSHDMPIGQKQVAQIAEAGAAKPSHAWKSLPPLLLDLWRQVRTEFGELSMVDEVDLETDPRIFSLWMICLTLRRASERLASKLSCSKLVALTESLGLVDQIEAPLRWVLLKASAAGTDELGDVAIEWLVACRDNFSLQIFRKIDGIDPAQEVIQRFAGTCSAAVYRKVEDFLLHYFPVTEWEELRSVTKTNCEVLKRGERPYLWRSSVGRAQGRLLEALPEERMSKRAVECRAVWRRKFGSVFKSPRGGAYSVVSPIPVDRVHLVSNSTWEYIICSAWEKKNRSARTCDDEMTEASHAMFSNDFRRAAHMMPSRFARLLLEIAKELPKSLPVYLNSLLQALAEKKAPEKMPEELQSWQPATAGEIEAVFRAFDHLHESSVAKSVCRIIEERSEEAWSSQVLDLVAELAASHSDPELDYEFAPLKEDEHDLIMYASPSNSVRCAAIDAISALLFCQGDLLTRFLPSILLAVEDPHVAVRVSVRGVCLPILNLDRDLAVDLYIRACDHPDDQALLPDRFFEYIWSSHSEQVKPLLQRMLSSRFPVLVERAAFWVVGGWIVKGSFSELAEECLNGGEAMRHGAAQALCSVFEGHSEHRERCWAVLSEYFLKEKHNCRRIADSLLRERDILHSEWGPRILEDLLVTHGFEQASFWLLHGLKDYNGLLTPYGSALRLLTQRLKDSRKEELQGVHWRLEDLPTLLLRLYDETEGNDELRKLSLDAWDRLLESGLEGTVRQLALIDDLS